MTKQNLKKGNLSVILSSDAIGTKNLEVLTYPTTEIASPDKSGSQ